MLSSSSLAVGLRNETGTIELLTPLHAPGGREPSKEPHFSFALPLTDHSVNLGPGEGAGNLKVGAEEEEGVPIWGLVGWSGLRGCTHRVWLSYPSTRPPCAFRVPFRMA